MPAVRITANTKEAAEFVKGLAAALSEAELDKIIDKVAMRVVGWLIEATPKGHTGNLRQNWRVVKPGEAQRIISNITTVETSRGPAFLLDMLADGTGRYGPAGSDVVPTNAARLYVPLTRRAAFGWRPGLQYGIDYVLAKSVRGIRSTKARRPVEQITPRAERLMESEVAKHLSSKIGI